MGANVSFTLFDFFGPIAGAFLGPIVGVTTVLLVEVLGFILKHETVTAGSIIRLFPTLFATYYFATIANQKTRKWILAVPVVAIILFILHPIGRTVWYYSLFWLVPVISYFARKNLFLRSLGATFTAHAVGGAAWIWAFSLPAQVWNNLIPIVIQERLIFAIGISASYMVMTYVLSFLVDKKIIPNFKTSPSY